MVVKLDFIDSTHKCYTNVVEWQAIQGFLQIIIANDSGEMTKLIPLHRINFAQVE
jgi:hypothetical protein